MTKFDKQETHCNKNSQFIPKNEFFFMCGLIENSQFVRITLYDMTANEQNQ